MLHFSPMRFAPLLQLEFVVVKLVLNFSISGRAPPFSIAVSTVVESCHRHCEQRRLGRGTGARRHCSLVLKIDLQDQGFQTVAELS